MARTLLYFFILLGFPLLANAQAYQWSVVMGAPDNSWGSKTAVDPNGNVYMACYAADSMPYVTPQDDGVIQLQPNLPNAVITKFSPQGDLLSHWTINPGRVSKIYDIGIDPSGNIFLMIAADLPFLIDRGQDSVSINFTTYPGANGVYLLKLDPVGNYLWHYENRSNISHRPTLTIDNTGNVFMAGIFSSQIDLDPDPNLYQKVYANGEGMYVVKVSPSGNVLWGYSCESTSTLPPYGYQITTDQVGNLLFFGHAGGNAMIFGEANRLTHRISSSGGPYTSRSFIQKVDPDGNHLFAHLWDGHVKNEPTGVTCSSDGKIFLTGTFDPPAPIDPDRFDLNPGPDSLLAPPRPGSGYPSAAMMIALDGTGEFLWGKSWVADGDVNADKVALSDDGWLLFAGSTHTLTDFDPGPLVNLLSPSHAVMAYLMAMDTAGNFKQVWTSQGDAEYASFFTDIEIAPDGAVYLHGETGLNTDLDPGMGQSPTLPGYGPPNNYVLYVSRWDPDAGVNDFRLAIDSLASPTCPDSGYISWYPINATPPVHYAWDGQPIGQVSNTKFRLPGPHLLTAIDSVSQTYSKHFLINGPLFTSGLDLRASLISTSMRPAVPETIRLDVSNQGCYPVDGEVYLILDTALTFLSSTPHPDRISGDSLFWTITQWTYDSGNMTIPVEVIPDTFVLGGQPVCMDVGVSEIFGDINLYNNLVHHCQFLVNSYDPNDIRVYPRGACEEGYVAMDQPLTYTIRFQNTGNAPAINIVIDDTLPRGLDISSVNILSHSHPGLVTELGPGNLVRFIHDGIYLPDSTHNEPESHGFIVFEVQPLAKMASGTVLPNRAGIYFDFNPPVITNWVSNTLVEEIPTCTSGIEEEEEEPGNPAVELALYPNPSEGTFTLAAGSEGPLENAVIQVYSASGKLVWQREFATLRMEEISLDQPNGVYFMRLSADGLYRTFRMMIRK